MSTKYPRSYHYTFSPGTTSDDRINHNWYTDVLEIPTLIHTEKLDGQGNCMNKYGVFARSHAAPTQLPWDVKMRERWEIIKHDLGDLEIFGESMYAVHSIEYNNLASDFYVFSVRCKDMWLSWEETQFFAQCFDLPTVPVLQIQSSISNKENYKENILGLTTNNSTFDSIDAATGEPCWLEGVVSRNIGEYMVDEFTKNLFKFVRKNHVKTDEHWSRNWRKANINYYGTY